MARFVADTTLACDRWGVFAPDVTDDPKCACAMCRARRWDKLTKTERATKRGERMRP